LEFSETDFELIPFFENLFPPALDKRIKSRSELGHPTAQILEPEINAWK
jgi:hypothetical protein